MIVTDEEEVCEYVSGIWHNRTPSTPGTNSPRSEAAVLRRSNNSGGVPSTAGPSTLPSMVRRFRSSSTPTTVPLSRSS